MIFRSVNPWSGELISETLAMGEKEVQSLLSKSELAFKTWSRTDLSVRLNCLETLGKLIALNSEFLSTAMSEEMGKPIIEARAEITKSGSLLEFYCKNTGAWLEKKNSGAGAKKAGIARYPLGGILLVMPWNFPLWQVLRGAVPALCSGNVILLKHAPNVFGFSAKLEKLFDEAGFPEGVFQNLLVDVPALDGIVSHNAVSAVSLTGSEAAGRSMAALAGKNLKKCVLELGGSDPFIVLPDANLELVSKMAAASRMINSGQSCIAAKRFLVHDSISEVFAERISFELDQFRPGNPILDETKMGPLARPDLVLALEEQLSATLSAGAKLAYRMEASFPETASCFLPTLLTDVKPGMPAFDEETFGPLAVLTSFSTIEEAIALANSSRFGLGASVHSENEELAREIAERLDCGTVAINSVMRSDPSLPFGGIKASGFGRELAEEGLAEFVNLKVIMEP